MKEKFNFVFERYEKKYLLTAEKYEFLRKKLEPFMAVDDYGLTSICNIYYDTPEYRIIQKSLDKPKYKEKFRIRSYGIPKNDSNVFLEIKKKYKGVVYKRRAVMTHTQALDYLNSGIRPYNSQIINEIDYFFKFYNPSPAVFLAYDRIAMYGLRDSELRMTFDANIRSRFDDLDLTLGDYGEPLLTDDNAYLLEIKTLRTLPVWLTEILSEAEIYPTSFSKYGRVYERMIERKISKSPKETTYV
ncbi:MAG: polyphosphate polymerase domain-containing protein [Clostridia bacterium]|nr:polyphosphate polymerase domain-containing protein [Clostridia bacterium]